jgi:DNA-binding NtrC family response regulator
VTTDAAREGAWPTLALVVEDDPTIRRAVSHELTRRGAVVVAAATVDEGRRALAERAFDFAVLDVQLPDGVGLELMGAPNAPARALVLTGESCLDVVDEAARAGAAFLQKPFSVTVFRQVVECMCAAADGVALRAFRDRLAPKLVGETPELLRVVHTILRVAETDASVLIHGETGSGKEVVAQALHRASKREGAFLAVNCAAMPEGLLEAELFGHTKGAFTGASAPRDGLFVGARDGTLLLDEIGELPLALQAKLLRVLQEREVTPVGSNRPIRVNARIVTATHRSLSRLCHEGRFREDLRYRLDVVRVELPPLRARVADIPLLAARFVRETADHHRRAITGVTPEALEHLMSCPWPGNVRELRNAIERAVVLSPDGLLGLESFTAARDSRPPPPSTVERLRVPSSRGSIERALEPGPPDDEPRSSWSWASAVYEPAHASGVAPTRVSPREAPSQAAPSPPASGSSERARDEGLAGAPPRRLPLEGIDLREALDRFEREMIRQALERTLGNKNRAAELLRIKRTTLIDKMRRLAIDEPPGGRQR